MFVDRFSLFASKALTSLTLLIALSTFSFGQTTYYVKPDGNDQNNGLSWANAKATIQAGINSATSGDSVWVAGGDQEPYLEQVSIPNSVKVYGGFEGDEQNLGDRDFNANRTTIDADGETYAVTFATNAGSATRLENFVVRGANGSGIVIAGDQSGTPLPVVFGCIVRNNEGATAGGGIYIEDAHPTISNCIIRDNSANVGGGVYALRGAPIIVKNLVQDNHATHSSGGGLYISNTGYSLTVFISENQFIGNIAGDSDRTTGQKRLWRRSLPARRRSGADHEKHDS